MRHITKEEVLDLISRKVQEDYVSGQSYTHYFVELDDVYIIIDKIYNDNPNCDPNCDPNLK